MVFPSSPSLTYGVGETQDDTVCNWLAPGERKRGRKEEETHPPFSILPLSPPLFPPFPSSPFEVIVDMLRSPSSVTFNVGKKLFEQLASFFLSPPAS